MKMRLSPRPLRQLKQLKKLLPFGKPIAVKRSTTTYLDKQGWKQSTSTTPPEWHGYFRTRFGSYKGKITASTPPQFYFQHPPEGLARHSHRACFHPLPGGWYHVHFSRVKDLDSGVIKLERILHEAFLLSQKTA